MGWKERALWWGGWLDPEWALTLYVYKNKKETGKCQHVHHHRMFERTANTKCTVADTAETSETDSRSVFHFSSFFETLVFVDFYINI